MSTYPALLLLIPISSAVVLWFLARRPTIQSSLAVAAASLQLLLAARVLALTATGTTLVHEFGNWIQPFGIVFAIDRLGALFLLLQSFLLLASVLALIGSGFRDRSTCRALPLLFMVSSGLSGAFQTADLFNLFVAFEVVLVASYLLLQVPGNERSLSAAFANLAINVLASIFFFVGVALLYGSFGTVNLEDLSARMALTTPDDLTVCALILLTAAFLIKAALVPIFFWLPATYPSMSGPVAAFFAGMMTKLGVFALFRTVPQLMAATAIPEALVWIGGASALIGVLAALSEYEMRRLLGFHIVSQVGYMILGLGLLTQSALAAAIFYLTHHIIVKASLFLVADILERRSGSRDLREMGIAAWPRGLLAVGFGAAGLSLAGLPPFSGFFAKLMLFRSSLESDQWLVLAVLAGASILTLASMLKIWNLVFSEAPEKPLLARPVSFRVLTPLLLLVVASLALVPAAGPLYHFSVDTADQLLHQPLPETATTVLVNPGGGVDP